MKYKVTLSNSASKFYESLNKKFKDQIKNALKELINYYEYGISANIDLEKMSDDHKYVGCFRLRTGSYRIIFIPRRTELIIFIVKMDKRQDVYKK